MIRSVLALGLLITLGAYASAATVHRSKLPDRQVRPAQRVAAPASVAVPGWTDEQTRNWLSYPRVSE